MNASDEKFMTQLEIATILDILQTVDNNAWDQIKTVENARRALLHGYKETKDAEVVGVLPPTAKAPDFPSIGQRIQFHSSLRPKRIAGRTGVVTDFLAGGKVKVKVDGTGEVFTRVPRGQYTIVDQDYIFRSMGESSAS